MEDTNTMTKNRQDARARDSSNNYSELERETKQRSAWNTTASNMELAEEDMNDPDLASSDGGGHSYMLQPG
jgi:hypothetical protein